MHRHHVLGIALALLLLVAPPASAVADVPVGPAR
jgi:hypothetical protein